MTHVLTGSNILTYDKDLVLLQLLIRIEQLEKRIDELEPKTTSNLGDHYHCVSTNGFSGQSNPYHPNNNNLMQGAVNAQLFANIGNIV